MKTELKQGCWASPQTLARYESVHFDEPSGLQAPIRKAVPTVSQQYSTETGENR
jgi:hypothetical protein